MRSTDLHNRVPLTLIREIFNTSNFNCSWDIMWASAEELSDAIVSWDYHGRQMLLTTAAWYRPERSFIALVNKVSVEKLDQALVMLDCDKTALQVAAGHQSAKSFMVLVGKASREALSDALFIIGDRGDTALHWAASCQSEEAFMALVNKVTPEALNEALVIPGERHWTVLHRAARSQSKDAFMCLIENASQGALSETLVIQAKLTNCNGWTPLHEAASCQSEEAFMALVNKVTPEALSEALVIQDKYERLLSDGKTPLHIAARKQAKDAFLCLIENASEDALSEALVIRDHNGRTALHIAAANQSKEAFMALVNKVTPEALSDALVLPDSDNNTALDIAARKQPKEAFTALIEIINPEELNAALVAQERIDGIALLFTARHQAECRALNESEYYFDTISQLIKNKDISFDKAAYSFGQASFPDSGTTLGHSLTGHADIQYLKLYLKFLKKIHNYDEGESEKSIVDLLNVKDSSGERLLDIALRANDSDKIELLIRHGAKSGRVMGKAWVAIHYIDPTVLDFDKSDLDDEPERIQVGHSPEDSVSNPQTTHSYDDSVRMLTWLVEPFFLEDEEIILARVEQDYIKGDERLKIYYDDATRAISSVFTILHLVNHGVIDRHDALGENDYSAIKVGDTTKQKTTEFMKSVYTNLLRAHSEIIDTLEIEVPFLSFATAAINAGFVEPRRNKMFSTFWQQAIFYTQSTPEEDSQLARSVARKLTIILRNDIINGVEDKPEELNRWDLFLDSFESWKRDDQFKAIASSQLLDLDSDAERDVAGLFFLIFNQENTQDDTFRQPAIWKRDDMVRLGLTARANRTVEVNPASELELVIPSRSQRVIAPQRMFEPEMTLRDSCDGDDEMKMGDDGELTSNPSRLPFHT